MIPRGHRKNARSYVRLDWAEAPYAIKKNVHRLVSLAVRHLSPTGIFSIPLAPMARHNGIIRLRASPTLKDKRGANSASTANSQE